MNINVNGGHCPAAPGASGILDELSEDRKIKDALIGELRSRGHNVSDSTSNASNSNTDLAYQVSVANDSGAELAISIHLNSGGGTGTEAFSLAGSKAQPYAERVSESIASCLGLRNRGAKTANYYWLRNTSMMAILVEVCFVDTQADADAYNRVGPSGIAKAIADAVCDDYFPQNKTQTGNVSNSRSGFDGGLYRCTVEDLRVRSEPSLSAEIVAHYSRGETVTLDSWYTIADGYVWGRYTGGSGKTRYVAVGKPTGGYDPNDYLVKVN